MKFLGEKLKWKNLDGIHLFNREYYLLMIVFVFLMGGLLALIV
jgi:hypothetical protein